MKLKLFFVAWAVTVCGVALLYCATEPPILNKVPSHSLHKSEKSAEQPLPDEPCPTLEANGESGKPVAYVLKYVKEENRVVLITRFEDGTSLTQVVESIDPMYLERDDLALLAGGIETSGREKVYMLIEDFSS